MNEDRAATIDAKIASLDIVLDENERFREDQLKDVPDPEFFLKIKKPKG